MKKIIWVTVCIVLILNSFGGIHASGFVEDKINDNQNLTNIVTPRFRTSINAINEHSDSYLNLLIVPNSVMIYKEYWFFPFTNRIEFTVKNEGSTDVEDVKISITIEYWDKLDKPSMETEHPATILYLSAGGSKTFKRPLFRSTMPEIVSAIFNFAGILYINVTVDPEEKYPEDLNRLDNTVKLPIEYRDIFPNLANLESIILKFF